APGRALLARAPTGALLVRAPEQHIHEVAEREEEREQDQRLDQGGRDALVPLALQEVDDDEHERREDSSSLEYAPPRRRLSLPPARACELAREFLVGLRRLACLGLLALDLAALLVDIDVLVLVAAPLVAPPPLLLRRHHELA